MASQIAKAARRVTHELHGVVVSAGLMEKTVKVRVGGQKWNKIVNKYYADPKHYLVHDPNNSLRTGDIVSIAPGWPTSQHKRHVIKHIIAPFGDSIGQRPLIPTLEELIAERDTRKSAKDERRAIRREELEQQKSIEKQRARERREGSSSAQSSTSRNLRESGAGAD